MEYFVATSYKASTLTSLAGQKIFICIPVNKHWETKMIGILLGMVLTVVPGQGPRITLILPSSARYFQGRYIRGTENKEILYYSMGLWP